MSFGLTLSQARGVGVYSRLNPLVRYNVFATKHNTQRGHMSDNQVALEIIKLAHELRSKYGGELSTHIDDLLKSHKKVLGEITQSTRQHEAQESKPQER